MKTTPFLDSKNIVAITRDTIDTFEPSLIRAYKEVFNASAWQEGKKCAAGCGKKWTFETSPRECCNLPPVDFYSESDVSGAIRSVLDMTYSQCIVLLDGNQEVAGFTWGWQDSLESINQKKLKLSPSEYSKLLARLTQLGDAPEKRNWYYQSETGIVPKYRNQGIGRQLVGENEQILRINSNRIDAIIQRTSLKSSMYAMRRDLGYKEVYQYGDIDFRVLFAKNNM